jgi:hypothetical protein
MPHTHLLHRKEKEQSILTSCKVLSLLMFDTTYFPFFRSCIHLKPHLAARGAEVCSSSIIKAGTWPSAPIHPAHIIRSTDKCSVYAHASVQFSEDQWDVWTPWNKTIQRQKQSGSLQEHENPGPGGIIHQPEPHTHLHALLVFPGTKQRTIEPPKKEEPAEGDVREETWGVRAIPTRHSQPPTCSPQHALHEARIGCLKWRQRLRGASCEVRFYRSGVFWPHEQTTRIARNIPGVNPIWTLTWMVLACYYCYRTTTDKNIIYLLIL